MRKVRAVLLALAVPFILNVDVRAEFSPQYKPEQITVSKDLLKLYKKVTSDPEIIRAIETMKGTLGDYSRKAILGQNVSQRPISVMFQNPAKINPGYANYDALGWKKKKQLYIYINPKHRKAPPEALASLLTHEALHQDQYNSINEETYAWTLEAATWTEFVQKNPTLATFARHPLVRRENTIMQLFIKGQYTDRYVGKTVTSNPGYANLPRTSPGFEDIKRLTRGLKPKSKVGYKNNTNKSQNLYR